MRERQHRYPWLFTGPEVADPNTNATNLNAKATDSNAEDAYSNAAYSNAKATYSNAKAVATEQLVFDLQERAETAESMVWEAYSAACAREQGRIGARKRAAFAEARVMTLESQLFMLKAQVFMLKSQASTDK